MDTSTPDLRAAVIRGALWVGTGQFAGQLVSWISTIVVIRLLSPSDYGLMAMCASFIWLLSLVSELGIGASIIQAKTITDEEIRRIYGVVILGSVGFAAVGHLAAPLVASFYDEPRLTALIRVMNVSFLISAFYVVPQSIAVRDLDFRLKTQVDLAAQVSGAVLMVGLAAGGAGIWTLVAGPIFGHAVRAAAYAVFGRGPARPSFDLGAVGPFLRYGLTLTGDRLAYYLHTVSDTVVIGRVLGHQPLGTYSVALTLASLPSEKILPVVTQVSFASYSRIQDDGERIRRALVRTIQTASFVAFPVFFLMSAVAPEAIRLVLGDKWAAIVLPFQILCLIMPLRAIAPILPPAVFAVGQPMVNLVNMIITFVVMALAFLAGVAGGVAGVCLAWLAAYPFVFLVATARSARALGLPPVAVLRELAFPFLASAFLLAAMLVVRAGAGGTVPLGMLALSSLAAVVAYAGLAVFFRRDDYLRLKAALFGSPRLEAGSQG
jgi:O-antigen/teichoic acid export membrane protein